jgi:hypothetical protein
MSGFPPCLLVLALCPGISAFAPAMRAVKPSEKCLAACQSMRAAGPASPRLHALRAILSPGDDLPTEKKQPVPAGVFQGRVVAITGNFDKRRPEVEQRIKTETGATFSGTVRPKPPCRAQHPVSPCLP